MTTAHDDYDEAVRRRIVNATHAKALRLALTAADILPSMGYTLDELERMDDDGWNALAELAGTRPPHTSRALCIEYLRSGMVPYRRACSLAGPGHTCARRDGRELVIGEPGDCWLAARAEVTR